MSTLKKTLIGLVTIASAVVPLTASSAQRICDVVIDDVQGDPDPDRPCTGQPVGTQDPSSPNSPIGGGRSLQLLP